MKNRAKISLILALSQLVVPCTVFANENSYNFIKNNSNSNYPFEVNENIEKYKAIELNEDIEKYIKNANSVETYFILGDKVTYYIGENYTIVKDSCGYYKIDFLSNQEVLVNGENVKSRIVVEEKARSITGNERMSASSLVKYDEKRREYNVIGLAPSVICGIVGGVVGAKIGGSLGQVFSIVGGAVVGLISGGSFDEYYISVITEYYYETPIITTRPKVVNKNIVYHGPKYDRYKNYWFTL